MRLYEPARPDFSSSALRDRFTPHQPFTPTSKEEICVNDETHRITLSPGPLSIFDANGSAVIVHLTPDRGETGVTGASGGARIACGVIQLVPDSDDDFNIGR